MDYPKRLIEVDLPIKRISAHARREKSIRHGHISTLHIWWARRPLAACRAVILAALWPDPADPLCPPRFLDEARKTLLGARNTAVNVPSGRSVPTYDKDFVTPEDVRAGLLDFIAEFANWDNSTNPDYLDFARHLVQVAHESLGGEPGTRPLVVDPFAGGGSIPLEALRVGADAFASDLNPVAVLLNKVVLEYIPKYGQRLADEVRKWGAWIKKQAEKELDEFYPKAPDSATPIAYLWARTIQCEGPDCGAEVPLIRSLWLAKKTNRCVALQIVANPGSKRVDFRIIAKQSDGWADEEEPKTNIENPKFDGTVKRGSATCPCCGYTTPVARVREQLKVRCGGTNDARMFCVVSSRSNEQGRFYRQPTQCDLNAVKIATSRLEAAKAGHKSPLSLVPDEKLDLRGIRHTWAMIYGLGDWGSYFTNRQALTLSTFIELVGRAGLQIQLQTDPEFARAAQTCLALVVSRETDKMSSIARWDTSRENPQGTFARQALPMLWDFNEVNPLSGSGGDWGTALDWVHRVCEARFEAVSNATVENTSAVKHSLPSDSANLFVTDPPYYDAVPYSYISDYFYVWLRRSLSQVFPELFSTVLVPKDAEIVVDRPHELSNSTHDIEFYERELCKAFGEGQRVLRPDGVGTIVFASKTTASWEAILKAVVDAGWIITGSWPIDTEMEARVAAQGQARLASSVHLICRPRERNDGSGRPEDVGEWRDVLHELPLRIHEWLPRLAEEGIVGADAIFACLGPALEIFSRYSRVEKANGKEATLREYLEHVWAAVSKEALSVIFNEADPTGFEGDARLTLIWFWVLKAATNGESVHAKPDSGEAEDDDEHDNADVSLRNAKQGFAMEFDAARKLAQGLGVDLLHLSRPGGILKISGNISVLFRVSEREPYLIGQQLTFFGDDPKHRKRIKKPRDPSIKMKSVPLRQEHLFDEEPPPRPDSQQPVIPGLVFPDDERTHLQRLIDSGHTILDRLHQAMLLFNHSPSGLLGLFLIESGMGNNDRFWLLAQSLSALYPKSSDEKRWVDGVLARKKGLGF